MKKFEERRKRTWCLTDLVTRNGKLHEALFWSNIGKFSALVAFWYNVFKGTDTEWLWFIVMGVLTAHEAYTRFIDRKNDEPIHNTSNRPATRK